MRQLALATMMFVCANSVAQASPAHTADDGTFPEGDDSGGASVSSLLLVAPVSAAWTAAASFSGEPVAFEASAGAPLAQLAQQPLEPADLASPAQALGTESSDEFVIKDPFEGFNRKMYAFNSVIDKYVIAPAAIAYARATPRRFRRGVSNALDNISTPVTFGNDVLQFKFKRAGVTLGRVILNSTIGIGGFFDVAAKIGLEKHQEDFGQTLATYGAPSGPYLFLPFFGPTSVRDAAAQPANIAMDPLTWTQFAGFRALRWSRVGLGALDARAEALRPLAEIRNTSPDPYVTIRTLYALSRRSAINDGEENHEDLPEFGDPLEFEEGDTLESPTDEPAAPEQPQDGEDASEPVGSEFSGAVSEEAAAADRTQEAALSLVTFTLPLGL